MRKFSLLILSLIYLHSHAQFTAYVDPRIGSDAHGHVFVGANVPFGAVQLGPVNISTGWDWCSGYHRSDSTIIGFAHTHLSGTGIGDLGDILVMPVVGDVKMSKGVAGKPETGYYSTFSHSNEITTPGHYMVLLDRYNIMAKLTATIRTGMHHYTFPASDNAGIIFDLKEGIGDRPVETHIERVNDSTIAGYRFSKGWAADQRIYFTAVFSKPFRSLQLFDDTTALASGINTFTGPKARAIFRFTTRKSETIQLKVGISPVSMENAFNNLTTEIPGWNFEDVTKNAVSEWDKALGSITVKTKSLAQLYKFYTALYHTMMAPAVFNDCNGEYRGTDKTVHKASFTNLSIFSLWDTYRATHPLYTLAQPQRVDDMINSLLAIYQQQHRLPVWHLMGNETNTMPGYSSVQVVADAYLKGFRGFDTALAWEAVKNTAMRDERGLKWVKQYGFIPGDSMVESVAMGLEYAIADASIAQMAKKMGKKRDYEYFYKRGQYYRNYFDSSIRFMRGRVSATQWRTPFSPFEAKHMKDDFTEGNAWQYSWLVPQDVYGLIQLMGGDAAFARKLDSLFVVQGNMGKEASADITGLIGQYAHGNEPSHHISYLYTYVGEPWKTADKVRYILDSLYTTQPDGLSGNEDVGQMSAWYVLSAIGLYQVNPAGGQFIIGSPVMDEIIIDRGNGKKFRITVQNNSSKNKYIQQVKLNGKPYTRSYINYPDIANEGELVIEMGNKPSAWGVKKSERP
ncbi:MAG: GH92 family glycosyl hydrolase [Chitinophagaceae bacterium]